MEVDLCETIMKFARSGFPFKTKKVRELAYQLATRNKRKGFSPTRKVAGKKWLKHFVRRHSERLRSKKAKNLSIGRAISGNPTQIGNWFKVYRETLTRLNLWYSPNKIWNVDECGVGDVPADNQQVLGVTGEPCSQTVSGEKPINSTVLTFVSAGGLATPPMVIFKGGRVAPEWREAAPTGYTIRASDSGYINQNHFKDYGQVFIRYLKDKNLVNASCCVTCTPPIYSTSSSWNI